MAATGTERRSPLLARRYTYDAAGNLTMLEDQRSGSALATTRYQYYQLGRIEGALRAAGGRTALDEVFKYAVSPFYPCICCCAAPSWLICGFSFCSPAYSLFSAAR